ncbi:MAG: hypothetical protein DRG30_09155, partial [Epsilonproteobacteria bacterium]
IEMILMDINMPIMNGYEATSSIRNDSKYDDIPIIALTANAMQKDIDKAKESGMQEHLAKPIDVPSLYTMLLKYIKPKVDTPQINENEEIEEEVYQTLESIHESDELNSDQGIVRAGGNKKLYQKILSKFVSIFEDSAEQLEELIKQKKLKEAGNLLHNIKGTAGNIGAINLYNLSVEFEEALNNKESDFTMLLNRYREVFKRLLTAIDKLKEEKKAQVSQKKMKPITQKELNDILTQISEKAKKRRAVECKKLSLKLEGYGWSQEHESMLKLVTKAIREYKFKIAIDAIEEYKINIAINGIKDVE